MPNRFAAILIATLLGSVSVAALAQPAPAAKGAPSTTVSPLTVQAAPAPKVIEKLTHSFVQSYAAVPNPEIDQIGRWHDPVCVQVVGLPQADQAALIKARIESVARAVDLPAPWTSLTGCRPNVEIVFTDQPQRIMDVVAKSREYLLGYYHFHDRDRLKTVTHPIQAWYVTETRGIGGSAGFIYQVKKEVIDDPENTPPDGCGDSRFSACLRSAFHNVFIVADSKVLEGQDLGLVADYLVMQPSSDRGCERACMTK